MHKVDTAAEPQISSHVGHVQSSTLHRQWTTLVFSVQRQVHGAMAAKSSVSKGEISEIHKILLVMTKGSLRLDVYRLNYFCMLALLSQS